MRKLNDTYWNKFTTTDENGVRKRDGVIFEDLVDALLSIEYGYHWTRTPKSHDNNRDFHFTTAQFTQWAECKNYNKPIALDVIAPTLVMAQIFEVNKLIFFSYSNINFSARKKIFSFGSKAKKEIEIFAENTLDELIIKNTKFLPESFRPRKEHINQTEYEHPLEYTFFFIQTPALGATLDDRDMISIPEVQKISYNTVFEIAFICTNNTLEKDYQVEIALNDDAGPDNPYFTVVDCESEDIPSFHHIQDIPQAGAVLNKYFFKSNRFKSYLTLPVFQVSIYKNGEKIHSFCSPIRKVKNQWIGKTILIGEKYRNIIKNAENHVLNNDYISCMTVYGPSGTGKTRLLKEMLDVLLKHKYRIVSFIGNENDSAYILLKELVYFIYEIPREEILKNLEQDIFMQKYAVADTPARQAYLLAHSFSDACSDEELIEIIEKSFDILYEKISQERIAIVIDNIQFFGNAMAHFLHKYIIYSKHQTRPNTSVLLLSVNLDYITDKSSVLLNYIQDLSKDKDEICCHEIKGFPHKNNGILFLRELLHIGDDSLDSEFEIILGKASLKPYYIYQAVYYLYEMGAVMNSDDDKGYIPYLEKFYDAVEIMPPQITDIISQRWKLFLNRYSLAEEELSDVIAAVYFFRELTNDLIKLLAFDAAILDLLNRHMFLRLNDNGNYCFDHDIIENFFSKRYSNMIDVAAARIRKCQASRKLSAYHFAHTYYKLYGRNLSSKKLQDIFNDTLKLSVSPKLAYAFYFKFLAIVLKRRKNFDDQEQWMEMVLGICNLAKNCIGIDKAAHFFETANDCLNREIDQSLLLTTAFRNYMNVYADLLFFQEKYTDAISYLKRIRDIGLSDKNDQCYALKAMVYNRLLINYRELPSAVSREQAIINLGNAKSCASKIHSSLLRDEFTYLNISDEGYNYYCLYAEKEKLLSIWNQCMDYPPTRLPQKAMNYYRKCAQINLINQNYFKVFENIQKALEYIEIHNSSQAEKLVFRLSFSVYRIMALLQENPVENKEKLLSELSHAVELSRLMSKRYLHHLFILRAIVCYYNGDAEGLYHQYKEAYKSYNKKIGTLFHQEKKDLLLANIYVSFQQFNILHKANEFLAKTDKDKFNRLNISLPNYEADGIQRTSDKLFNLPCI